MSLYKYLYYSIFILLLFSFVILLVNTFKDNKKSFSITENKKYYIDYINAMNWLKTNTPKNSIILTEWSQGHQVVLLSKRKVIATSKVYPSESKEIMARYSDLSTFFYSKDLSQSINILRKHNVSYLFIRKNFDFNSSCKEQDKKCNYKNPFLLSLISGSINEYKFLNKVYENNSVIIYKYSNPSQI